jgi:hypothetical protein
LEIRVGKYNLFISGFVRTNLETLKPFLRRAEMVLNMASPER